MDAFGRIIEIGDIEFYPAACLLTCGDRREHVTPGEADYLEVLTRHVGSEITVDKFMRELYGARSDMPGDNILAVYQSRLRQTFTRLGSDVRIKHPHRCVVELVFEPCHPTRAELIAALHDAATTMEAAGMPEAVAARAICERAG